MDKMFRDAGDERQHVEDSIQAGEFEMMKCQCCHEQEASYAWQPFGPSEDNAATFTLLGNHYRGFPVIKVCYGCKNAFETGDFPVRFNYKGFRYVGQNHEVREMKPSFWDGGTTSLNLNGDATMIMKDTPKGSELVALVTDKAFVDSFAALPDLIEACEMVAEAFPDWDGLTPAQTIALADVGGVLKALFPKRYREL